MILLDSDVMIDLLRQYLPAMRWFDALDALIGQIAVALRVPLYTFNQKHYRFIPELRTIQPYEKIT